MRGKRQSSITMGTPIRITPACAGKTFEDNNLTFSKKDHPRVCGENRILVGYPGEWEGSPPRVRGKPVFSNFCCQNARITPACAGKTQKSRRLKSSTRDHPRVCGENYQQPAECYQSQGSPPRVRGKPWDDEDADDDVGITPACAGKTI